MLPYVAFNLGLHCFRPPDKRAYWKTDSLFLIKKYVVDTQKNCLNEAVLLSTQNTCLN